MGSRAESELEKNADLSLDFSEPTWNEIVSWRDPENHDGFWMDDSYGWTPDQPPQ